MKSFWYFFGEDTPHWLPKKCEGISSNEFHIDRYLAPRTIEKMKPLGAVLELPAKQHCQSSLRIGPNWPNRHCCLAGSSKTAPRIFIFFFNCHGCRLFISCEIHSYFCPHIFWVYFLVLASVTQINNDYSYDKSSHHHTLCSLTTRQRIDPMNN